MSATTGATPQDLYDLVLEVHWAVEHGAGPRRRRAEQIEADGYGLCSDYATVLAARLLAAGIPCRQLHLVAKGLQDSHAWVEVNLGGRWSALDPTFAIVVDDARATDFLAAGDWRERIHRLPGRYDSNHWGGRYYEEPFLRAVSRVAVLHGIDPPIPTTLAVPVDASTLRAFDNVLPVIASTSSLLAHPGERLLRLPWLLLKSRGRMRIVDVGAGRPWWLRLVPSLLKVEVSGGSA